MRKPYAILGLEDPYELEREVAAHLAAGYELAGGVCVDHHGSNPVFFQALKLNAEEMAKQNNAPLSRL